MGKVNYAIYDSMAISIKVRISSKRAYFMRGMKLKILIRKVTICLHSEGDICEVNLAASLKNCEWNILDNQSFESMHNRNDKNKKCANC